MLLFFFFKCCYSFRLPQIHFFDGIVSTYRQLSKIIKIDLKNIMVSKKPSSINSALFLLERELVQKVKKLHLNMDSQETGGKRLICFTELLKQERHFSLDLWHSNIQDTFSNLMYLGAFRSTYYTVSHL